jgi:B12-binding domain/radical SAM domain protein
MNNIALVLYYTTHNRYSFNALIGAIETVDDILNNDVYFLSTEDRILTDIKDIINKYDKVVVLMSFFTSQVYHIYKIITALRERYKSYEDRLIYIAGGAHPTGVPEQCLRMGFDIVVIGEGEETLIDILYNIQYDRDYTSIKGIRFIDSNGRYCFTGKRDYVNLNKYLPFSVKYNRFGPIEITRGCPFGCYFCQTTSIFGTQVRHRDVDKICEYINIMIGRGIKDIRFITPNAFSYGSSDGKSINIAKLEELLQSIRDVGKEKIRIFMGSFPSEVRPEHVTRDTVDLVRRYADNDNLIIGAQSGSQRILDICHRGHTVDDIYNAVQLTISAGLKANVDFIFGLPGETIEDIKLTMQMMNKLVKIGARIHAHTFMPLPQTKFANSCGGKIAPELKSMIKKLISNGMLYGYWEAQEKIAESRYKSLSLL